MDQESKFDNKKPRPKSPRETHGTRVRFRIECARCGESDVLPFVPKTKGESLCRSCAKEVFGENWAHGREFDKKYEYTIECAECGQEAQVPFEPDGSRDLLCSACFRGEGRSRKERLAGMKKFTS